MVLEVKMPLYRITKRADDGSVLETEPEGEVWVPGFVALPGLAWKGDEDLRLGTPSKFETRRKED